jgi:hypothetical protein
MVSCVVLAPMDTWLKKNLKRKKKTELEYMTGVDRDELKKVWLMAKHALITHYELEHTQRTPQLSPYNSLLATLHYLWIYPSTRRFAAQLDVAVKSLREAIEHALDALYVSLVLVEFAHLPPLPAAFSIGPLAGVGAVVDATPIAIPRIADRPTGKKYYHKKSPTKEAVKVQITVTLNGVVVHISHVVRGAQHDVTLFRASELLDELPLATKLLADKGYIGEEPRVITPKKKPRLGELKAEEKKADTEKHSARVVVENSIRQLKRWAILGGVYRGKWRHDASLQKLTKIVRIVGALARRRLKAHPLRTPHTRSK